MLIRHPQVASVFLVLLALLVPPSKLPAATLVWTNTGGGSWTTAANWSPNAIPASADHILITNTGNYTINLDANATVTDLTLGGAANTQTLSINGSTVVLTVSGVVSNGSHGTLTGSGTLAANGLLVWSGGLMSGSGMTSIGNGATNLITGDVRLSGRTLNNAGSILWSGGQISTDGNATITNLANALFDAQFDGSLTGTRIFNNAGTVRKSAGGNTATLTAIFNNLQGGLVEVRSGTLSLNGGGTHSGSFAISNNATLSILAVATNTHNFDVNTSIAGPGNVKFSGIGFPGTNGLTQVNGAYAVTGASTFLYGLTVNFNAPVSSVGATLAVSGGTVNFNQAATSLQVSNLSVTAGSLGGNQTMLTVSGPMIWNNSAITNSGTITANGGLTINGDVVLDGWTINNTSNATWSAGQIRSSNGAVINNASGAGFDITFDGVLLGGAHVFNNRGVFRKTGGTNVCNLDGAFNNTGTNHLQKGTVNFTGSYVQSQPASATLLEGGNLSSTNLPIQIQAGVLEGAGTITGSLTNSGLIDLSRSRLTIVGNYTQTASGVLNLDLFSLVISNRFPLVVSNNAVLGGTVNVLGLTSLNNFDAVANRKSAFVTYAAHSGAFAALNYPSNLVGLQIAYDPAAASIQVLNVPPIFRPIPLTNINEQVAFTLSLSNFVTDADIPPQTLTFEILSVLPANVFFSPTGDLFWTPAEDQGPGSYDFTARVVDVALSNVVPSLSATQSFTIVVNEVNVAPLLVSPGTNAVFTIAEGTLLTVTNVATDSDIPANPLAFTLLSLVTNGTAAALNTSGIALDLVTGVLTWTPTEAQGPSSNFITIVVTDTNQFAVNSKSLSATNSFAVIVTEVNNAPYFTAPSNNTVFTLAEGTLLTVTNTAADTDFPPNPLTYSLLSFITNGTPAALTNSGILLDTNTGVLTWTPSETQGPSSNVISVVVTDTNSFALANRSLSATNSFIVIVTEANTAPYFVAPTNNAVFTVGEGSLLSVTNVAQDDDLPPNPLTYALVALRTNGVLASFVGSGISIDVTNGILTWTPNETQGGISNYITVSVTDTNAQASTNWSLSATNSFTVLVNEINTAPQFVVTGGVSQIVLELTTNTFTITTVDADLPRNPITYTVLPLPSPSITFTTNNGTNLVFTVAPTEGEGPTNYVINILATDTNALALTNRSLTANLQLNIDVQEVNTAPRFTYPTNSPRFTNNELSPFTLTLQATDSDIPANPLSYSLITATNRFGATVTNVFLSTNGVLNWTPSEAQGPSTNTFLVRVTDNSPFAATNQNLSATNTFTVVVPEINSAPVILTPANGAIYSVYTNTTLSLTISAFDADLPTNALTFSLTNTLKGANSLTQTNGTNAIFSWRPGAGSSGGATAGVYRLAIRVVDNGKPALSNELDFTVIVKRTNTNSAPFFVFPTNRMLFPVSLGSNLMFTASALDIDYPSNILSYQLVAATNVFGSNISSLSFDTNTAAFSWNPTNSDLGSNFVTLRVVDNGSPRLSNDVSFTVFVISTTNTPALVVAATNVFDEMAGNSITIGVTNADVPDELRNFSIISAPSPGIMIDPQSGVLSWTPLENEGPSTNSVVVNLSVIGSSLTVTTNFIIIVNEINTAPVFTNPPSGAFFNVRAAATNLTVMNGATDSDVPANSLTFALLGAPPGASIDPVTGLFSWAPLNTDLGMTNIYVVVTDTNAAALTNQQLSSTNYFTVAVRGSNAFAPTMLLSTNIFVFNEMTNNSLTLGATDADLPTNRFTFALVSATNLDGSDLLTNVSLPTVDTTTGVLSWQPGEDQAPSTNVFVVSVTDDGFPALSATTNFTIVVNEVNTAPAFTFPGSGDTFTVGVGAPLLITNSVLDADLPANGFFFTATTLTNASFSTNGTEFVLSFTPSAEQAWTTNTVTVTVTDTNAADATTPQLSATNTFTILVTPPLPTNSLSLATNGLLTITINGQPGLTYLIQTASDLTSPIDWSDLLTTNASASPFSITETNVIGTNRFYRVLIVP